MAPISGHRALEGLNSEQREAVESSDGPKLIIAGAGSGKTRVLVHRIAHLLETGRARPSQILAITFTNRAAAEMRERLESLIDEDAGALWAMTFHAACARILRTGADRLGYDRSFTIYDEADGTRMIKRCMEELGIDPKQFNPRAVKAWISAAKNTLRDPTEFASGAEESTLEQAAAEVHALYERRMIESNAMDFDDLLVRTVNLLELDSSALARWRRTFRHVLVDEYQDTNRAQYRLLQLLCDEHRNLFVVGDEDQSIYSFRHADIGNILDFDRDFPEAEVFKLERNYRSTQTILSAANASVAHNRDRRPKQLWTDLGEGDPVKLVELADEHEEARWVAGEVDRLVSEEGLSRSDLAVFYRVNAMSRALEDVLTRAETPYRVIGGTRFYERAEVKDVIAYLSLAINPADSASFERIVNMPRRGIGQTTQARLLSYANTTGQTITEVLESADSVPGLGAAAIKAVGRFNSLMSDLREAARAEMPLGGLIERVLTATGYVEALEAERSLEARGRIENLRELANVAAELESSGPAVADPEVPPLQLFLQHVSLHSQQDELDFDDGGQVSLMSLHNAKGLEFDAVFVIGVEDGVLPHSRALEEGGEEEERRLFYVAMTRARRKLYLTSANLRRVYSGPEPRLPSRFLSEIPEELVERPRGSSAVGRPRLRPGRWVSIADTGPDRGRIEAAPSFKVGEAVSHESFGEGKVTAIEQGEVVVVRFKKDGRERKLMSGYAPLQRLQQDDLNPRR